MPKKTDANGYSADLIDFDVSRDKITACRGLSTSTYKMLCCSLSVKLYDYYFTFKDYLPENMKLVQLL